MAPGTNRPPPSSGTPSSRRGAPLSLSRRVGVVEAPAGAPHEGQKRGSPGTSLEQAEQELTVEIYRVLHPFVHREVVAARGAGIDLAGTGDLLLRIEEHLLPLRQPAGRARDG